MYSGALAQLGPLHILFYPTPNLNTSEVCCFLLARADIRKIGNCKYQNFELKNKKVQSLEGFA